MEDIIKKFTYNNPIPGDNIMVEFYNNCHDPNYVKIFAKNNFKDIHEMREFYYDFIYITPFKHYKDDVISSLPYMISSYWDGINGWKH